MEKNGLKETRKQMMAQMEQRLQEIHPKEEDRMFYYHSSEINPCILLVAMLCKSEQSSSDSHPLPRDSKSG
jgi:hypothetical protein